MRQGFAEVAVAIGTDRLPTIVDLLDSFFGGSWGPTSASKLSDRDLDYLAEAVDEFYTSYQLKEVGNSTYRCYSGGATFMQHATHGAVSSQKASLFLPFARSALLYADQISFDCPLDQWIFDNSRLPLPSPLPGYDGVVVYPAPPHGLSIPGYWASSPDQNRSRIGDALHMLAMFEPGIRAGWLLPIPNLRYWYRERAAISSQVRHDVESPDFAALVTADYHIPPATTDYSRGLGVTLNDPTSMCS